MLQLSRRVNLPHDHARNSDHGSRTLTCHFWSESASMILQCSSNRTRSILPEITTVARRTKAERENRRRARSTDSVVRDGTTATDRVRSAVCVFVSPELLSKVLLGRHGLKASVFLASRISELRKRRQITLRAQPRNKQSSRKRKKKSLKTVEMAKNSSAACSKSSRCLRNVSALHNTHQSNVPAICSVVGSVCVSIQSPFPELYF